MDQPLKMSGGSIEPMPQPPVHQKYREQNLYDPAGRGDSAPNGEAQRRHTKSGFQRRQGDASLIASIEGVLPDSAASFQSPGLGDRHGKDTVNVPIGQSPQGTLKYGHDMQTATSSNASHAQHQVGGTSKFPPSDPKHRQNQNVNHPINKAGVPQRPDAFLGNQLPMSEAQYWENLVVNFDKENGLDGPNGYTAGSTIGVPNAGFGASMGGDITGYVRRDAEEVGKNSQFQTNGRRPVETTAPSTSSKRHTSSSHAASEMEPSQNHTNEGSAQREEPTAGDHQPDDPNFMYGLAFKNSEDMTIARKQTAFHCLQPDPSIPNTDLAKRKVVRQVMDAILAPPAPAPNTANRRNAYGGRFAPGKAYYTALDIEEVAWILVEAAADVHKNGFTARQADRQVLADMAKTKDWSFAERMNLICDILRKSKATCVALLKNDKFWTLIGRPDKVSKDVEHNKINNEKRGEVYKATKRMLQAQGQPQAQSQPQAAIEQTQNLNAFGVSNTNLSMTGPTQDPQNSGFNIHPAALGHVDPRFPEFPTAGNLTQDDIAMNMNNFIYPERVPDPVEPGPLQAFQSLPTAPAAATVAPGLSNAGSGPWLQQPNAVVRQQGPAVAPNMAPSLKRYRDQDDEVDHEVVKKGKTNTLAAVQAATLANAVKVPRRKKSKAPVASSTTAQTTGQVQPAQVPAKTGNTGKAGEAHTDGKDVKGTKGRK